MFSMPFDNNNNNHNKITSSKTGRNLADIEMKIERLNVQQSALFAQHQSLAQTMQSHDNALFFNSFNTFQHLYQQSSFAQSLQLDGMFTKDYTT
jgi:hypothetical protein